MSEPAGSLATATSARSLGDGTHVAHLHPDWTVRGQPHGGYLLALLARTACADGPLEPLAVSAQFLRPAQTGPVLLRSRRVKAGQLVTVVHAELEQSGRVCVSAEITLGELPIGEPEWSPAPDVPANPPEEAVDVATTRLRTSFGLTGPCDLRLGVESAEPPPRLRLWVRPREGQPDPLFALAAGEMSVPVTEPAQHASPAATVQLTAFQRTYPANGWLRLAVRSCVLRGSWFDQDTLVLDSLGRVVSQTRKLAVTVQED